MIARAVEIPVHPCPHCGKANDAVTSTMNPEAFPKEGDLTVCASCGNLSKFMANLQLESLPPEEFAALDADIQKHMLRVQAAFRQRLN